MASAEVEICNLALARLGARSIVSLTEDSVNARECNRVYAHARDTELRSHPWSFARTRVQLAALSTPPIFGYANQFPLPDDYLRILTDNGRGSSLRAQDDFQIEFTGDTRVILTDLAAPINLVYIRTVTDVTQFDQLFTDLLVARIAHDVCEKITQSNSKRELAVAAYTAAKREARRINGFERGAQEAPEDPWLIARR